MNEFELFNEVLNKYNTNNNLNEEKICEHNDIISNEKGIIICLECGEQIEKSITHEKEWRFYGSYDSKRTTDPNRVQMRKTDERNIYKDVENMGFSDIIISKANNIYNNVTKGQIYRGESRKAVVFACVYYAYKMSGKSQIPKNLMQAFNLNKKNSLKGLKIININSPKDSIIYRNNLTAVDHISDIMKKFSATENQINEVIELYNKTKNRSSKLNRARPQSVAASLTYYWICKNNMNINIKKFAQQVELSELTITKNTKEVSKILDAVKVP